MTSAALRLAPAASCSSGRSATGARERSCARRIAAAMMLFSDGAVWLLQCATAAAVFFSTTPRQRYPTARLQAACRQSAAQQQVTCIFAREPRCSFSFGEAPLGSEPFWRRSARRRSCRRFRRGFGAHVSNQKGERSKKMQAKPRSREASFLFLGSWRMKAQGACSDSRARQVICFSQIHRAEESCIVLHGELDENQRS